MIEKKFQCKVQLCGKTYASENALCQHIKLKHSKSNSLAELSDSE